MVFRSWKIYIPFVFLLLAGQGCISLSGSGSTTTGPAGMWVSGDKGNTWQQISLLPQAGGVRVLSGVSVFRLGTDPQDPKALYWASRDQGFFYSYDDGNTWRQPAPPLNTGFVYSVAVDPRDKCNIYAATGGSVYKSDDCSRSWKEVYRDSSGDHVAAVAFNPFNPRQVFLAKAGGDLLQSSDNAVSWSVMKRFGTRIESFIPDPFIGNTFYVASRTQGLYRTQNGGTVWDNLGSNLKEFPGALEYRRLYLHPTKKSVIYWISTYGILVSEDTGNTWMPMNLINAPGSANIYAFAVNPKNDKEIYYTATIAERSTFYRSADGGKSWITKKLPTDQRPTALRVHPVNENVVYIGFTIPPKQ